MTVTDGIVKYKCPHCFNFLTASNFQIRKGNPSGWCVKCRNNLAVESRRRKGMQKRNSSCITEMGKLCTYCKQVCSFECFSPSPRGLAGLSTACNECCVKKSDRSKIRKSTAAYRKRHKERVQAAHRLHQFKRRSLTKAHSDGTVTDEILKDLLKRIECFYCKKHTNRKFRTLDHMTPLSRGGAHSASNLVMACLSCNTSKRDKTAEEYYVWRRERCGF